MTLQFPPLPSSFDFQACVLCFMMCAGRGRWHGPHRLRVSPRRKAEIHELTFPSQLTNALRLLPGPPDVFVLHQSWARLPLCLLSGESRNVPCGLEEPRTALLQICFVCLVRTCTLPSAGFKAFSLGPSQPVTADTREGSHRSSVTFSTSHTQRSLQGGLWGTRRLC